MADFYNSANEKGTDLKESREKAAIQERKVLDLFLSNPTVEFTSDEVHKAMVTFEFKTSTRRCITNLKNKGFVIDTEKRKKGSAGKLQKVWKKTDKVVPLEKVKVSRHDKYLKALENLKKFEDVMHVDMKLIIDIELA